MLRRYIYGMTDIYSHLQENTQCQEKVTFDCFEITDRASSYFITYLQYLSDKCIFLFN